MKVKYRVFRGPFSSWKALFEQAAEFATEIGKEKLINISPSEDWSSRVVIVWYWSDK
jgi:hypothetical protein